ncbi:MAG TPA: plastocyanin/azurin family copper-binding protein [Gemmatimonadaceae bacterium]|nr:plastocyanin/azurin family copper-binding protein [Gemmatimonadaceae bacterium]
MRSLQFFAFASLIAVAACGSDSNTAPEVPTSTNAVAVADFAFTSSSIQVTPGTTVTWTLAANASQHNVTFSDGIASANLNAGAKFTRTFATAGTFAYHCTIHPQMTGTVTVK